MKRQTNHVRATLHMCLAAYLSDEDSDVQIRRMAKRYKRTATRPAFRRTMTRIIKSNSPAKVTWAVYKKDIHGKQIPKE